MMSLPEAGLTSPIIMMSGYPSDQLRVDANDSGVYCFLAKPFEPEQLIAAVFAATGHAPPIP